MATIRDVAKLAGVSISTVSLALNDTGKVNEDTYQRIWQAARDVGYVADPVAQSLKSGRSRLIGMIVGDISNPFFGKILQEVERYAIEKNHLVIVSESRADPERELAILDQLSGQRVAGVILSPHGKGREYVERIAVHKMPIVMLDHKVEGIDADFIGSDNALASAMLTEHLIRWGHRRIAHIAGITGLWTAEQRLKGFCDTMAAAGLPVDEALIVRGEYDGEISYTQAMRLLTRADRPTAILAANNITALGALQAINDLGLKCPSDISLTCIDDVPWSNVISPKLTMAVQSIDEIARVASKWLLERIASRAPQTIDPRVHIVDPRLVIGQSCAAPATSIYQAQA
jgi:LacI family transcriptional regulator